MSVRHQKAPELTAHIQTQILALFLFWRDIWQQTTRADVVWYTESASIKGCREKSEIARQEKISKG